MNIDRSIPIVSALKSPFNLALFVVSASLFFQLNYWAMANLPGSRNFMCVIGAHLTGPNVALSILLSIALGLFVAGIAENNSQKDHESSLKVSSVSGVAATLGTLTSFCTVCTLPVIGLFGLGSMLTFISNNQLYFKALSLVIFVIGLRLLNNQLRKQCGFLCSLKK